MIQHPFRELLAELGHKCYLKNEIISKFYFNGCIVGGVASHKSAAAEIFLSLDHGATPSRCAKCACVNTDKPNGLCV